MSNWNLSSRPSVKKVISIFRLDTSNSPTFFLKVNHICEIFFIQPKNMRLDETLFDRYCDSVLSLSTIFQSFCNILVAYTYVT